MYIHYKYFVPLIVNTITQVNNWITLVGASKYIVQMYTIGIYTTLQLHPVSQHFQSSLIKIINIIELKQTFSQMGVS